MHFHSLFCIFSSVHILQDLFNLITFQVSEVYTKDLKGAISALASLQGHLLIASGPKIILHKWTGSELNGVAFFDVPPLYVVSLNIVCAASLRTTSLIFFIFLPCSVLGSFYGHGLVGMAMGQGSLPHTLPHSLFMREAGRGRYPCSPPCCPFFF